jgi:hypothetical protein
VKVLIELDAEQERRLRDLAAEVRRSEQDLCLEAVERYLEAHGRSGGEAGRDRYGPFRKMIGLVRGGPTDASIAHDVRPGDAP